MKIEFKEETQFNGNPYYFTEIDGFFQSNSLNLDRDKAYELFKRLVAEQGFKKETKIIETIEL